MAGEILNSFPENTGPETPFVTVKVADGLLDGKAIPLYALPGDLVLDMMVTPEPWKMAKLVDLLRLAMEPTQTENIELLSFREMTEAVAQWVTLSTDKESQENAEAYRRDLEEREAAAEGRGRPKGRRAIRGADIDNTRLQATANAWNSDDQERLDVEREDDSLASGDESRGRSSGDSPDSESGEDSGRSDWP